mgnify:CR=1 FL=1
MGNICNDNKISKRQSNYIITNFSEKPKNKKNLQKNPDTNLISPDVIEQAYFDYVNDNLPYFVREQLENASFDAISNPSFEVFNISRRSLACSDLLLQTNMQ